MYDELKEEEIVNLIGGRFKLSTLIQKRLVQLNQGANPLIDTTSEDKMEIVLQETEGNRTKASNILGINRNTLRKKIQDYNIKCPNKS